MLNINMDLLPDWAKKPDKKPSKWQIMICRLFHKKLYITYIHPEIKIYGCKKCDLWRTII
jgi:hypothetical protein